jgi:hypothetical protein
MIWHLLKRLLRKEQRRWYNENIRRIPIAYVCLRVYFYMSLAYVPSPYSFSLPHQLPFSDFL